MPSTAAIGITSAHRTCMIARRGRRGRSAPAAAAVYPGLACAESGAVLMAPACFPLPAAFTLQPGASTAAIRKIPETASISIPVRLIASTGQRLSTCPRVRHASINISASGAITIAHNESLLIVGTTPATTYPVVKNTIVSHSTAAGTPRLRM